MQRRRQLQLQLADRHGLPRLVTRRRRALRRCGLGRWDAAAMAHQRLGQGRALHVLGFLAHSLHARAAEVRHAQRIAVLAAAAQRPRAASFGWW